MPSNLLAFSAKPAIGVDLPFSSFCSTEKSVVPSAAGTTTSPSRMAEAALIRKASSAIFLHRRLRLMPLGVNSGALVGEAELDAVDVELDLVDQGRAFRNPLDRSRQRW